MRLSPQSAHPVTISSQGWQSPDEFNIYRLVSSHWIQIELELQWEQCGRVLEHFSQSIEILRKYDVRQSRQDVEVLQDIQPLLILLQATHVELAERR